MTDVPLDRLPAAEMVLSILPPAHALSFARQMAPLLLAAEPKPVFVDCNAVSPETVRQIGAVISAAGAPFVDASIIGLAPRPGQASPHFYACGVSASRLQALSEYGLDVRVLDGAIGAASALKMSYAGINKGVAAIATAMILAASRSGATQALYQEMSESLPGFSTRSAARFLTCCRRLIGGWLKCGRLRRTPGRMRLLGMCSLGLPRCLIVSRGMSLGRRGRVRR